MKTWPFRTIRGLKSTTECFSSPGKSILRNKIIYKSIKKYPPLREGHKLQLQHIYIQIWRIHTEELCKKTSVFSEPLDIFFWSELSLFLFCVPMLLWGYSCTRLAWSGTSVPSLCSAQVFKYLEQTPDSRFTCYFNIAELSFLYLAVTVIAQAV